MSVILENPWLLGAVAGFVVINAMMVTAAWSIWFERKFAGAMQNRPGPTQVGWAGLLQPVADLLKLIQKEDIVPTNADRALFNLAPPLGMILVLAGLAVFPWAPGWVPADLDIGLLFILSISSLITIPVWMAGWASNNKYALLGGMRAAAQAVSFEVPLLLSALVPIILGGSLRLGDIVAAQADGRWFALWPPGPGSVAFVLFMLASLAEANRIPFDIPEAESELVAGITTEYVGMKFGLIYLAEYLHTAVSSLLGATLFLGGWDGPGPDGIHWLLLKSFALFAGIFWVRWTLLRYRADQFMALCWRVFVPVSLACVAVAAVWRVYA
ncbi:NADH-quinone oxidoreductase subunit H [Deltaproteobacteria bacterium]|nr:NADH-quinone oxidoreductase subunit H [Deltaproteobacteria bacterium]